MGKFNFTPEKKIIGGLLQVGQHIVECVEASIVYSNKNDEWDDVTPQLKCVYKNDAGQITSWLNLQGYKNSSDFEDGRAPKGFEFRSYDENSESFLVSKKTDEREVSKERTEKLMQQVGNLAYAIESDATDEKALIADLVGAELGIIVKENSRDKLEVSYTMRTDETKVSETADA